MRLFLLLATICLQLVVFGHALQDHSYDRYLLFLPFSLFVFKENHMLITAKTREMDPNRSPKPQRMALGHRKTRRPTPSDPPSGPARVPACY